MRHVGVLAVLALVLGAAQPAVAAQGHGGLAFVAPTADRLDGLVDIEVSAPPDTRAVRFSMDGTAFAELTRLYAEGTKSAPIWRTATDASWFSPGRHRLRAEAVTDHGTVTTTTTVTTRRPDDPRGVQNLNGDWNFAVASELPAGALEGDVPPAAAPDFSQAAMTRVLVPGSFGAIRDRWNAFDGQLSLYRKDFTAPAGPPGDRVALVFDSCLYACSYFVNGHKVGGSVGGYLPDRVDVTDVLRPGKNSLAVVVDNRTSTVLSYGTGTKYYWNWGGLLQGAHLERTAPLALTGFTAEGLADGSLTLRADAVNTTGADRSVPAEVTVTGPHGEQVLRTRAELAVASGSDSAAPVALTVPDPHLWSMDDPALYQVHLRPDTGRELHAETGFRTVAVQGSDVLLNGAVVRNLRGFNRHTDYPGLGRTQPDGLAYRDLKRLRDRGFTLFRPAHYSTTPGELAVADRLGLLMIEEINVTGAPADQLASARTQDFAKDRLGKQIRRDRGHPALFALSVGNEYESEFPGGADYTREVTTFGRALDPHRLFTHVSNKGQKDLAYQYDDVVAANRYPGWYGGVAGDIGHGMDGVQTYSGGKPIVLSEYGAEAVKDRPGTGRGAEYYQAQLVDTINQGLENRPHLLGQMYWTSTEFAYSPAGGGGNPIPVPGYHNKGLLTYFRDEKLAWRVITTPVRLRPVPVVTAAEGALSVTLDSVHGRASSGTVLVTAPDGVTTTPVPFAVAAGGSATVRVPLSGDGLTAPGEGMVRAVVDEHTEALPLPFTVAPRGADTALALDAGGPDGVAYDGYRQLAPATAYTPEAGYGWVGAGPDFRDRAAGPDELQRDLAASKTPATLRITVPAGPHTLSVLVGDQQVPTQDTVVTADGAALTSLTSVLTAGDTELQATDFAWLSATLDGGAQGRTVDLGFSTTRDYWKVAAVVLR